MCLFPRCPFDSCPVDKFLVKLPFLRRLLSCPKPLEAYERDFPDIRLAHLIYWAEGEFVIGVDMDCDIDWEAGDKFTKVIAEHNGKIQAAMNRLAELEAFPVKEWPYSLQLAFKRMLGEALARAFNLQFDEAEKSFDKARSFAGEKAQEMSRYWLIKVNILFLLPLLLCVGLLSYQPAKMHVSDWVGMPQYYALLASLMGGLGAITSVLSRVGSLNISPGSRRWLHYAEGVSRISTGFLFAMAGIISMTAGIFMPVVLKDHSVANLLFFGFVFGFSERLAPSILHKFDDPAEKRAAGSANFQSSGGHPAQSVTSSQQTSSTPAANAGQTPVSLQATALAASQSSILRQGGRP